MTRHVYLIITDTKVSSLTQASDDEPYREQGWQVDANKFAGRPSVRNLLIIVCHCLPSASRSLTHIPAQRHQNCSNYAFAVPPPSVVDLVIRSLIHLPADPELGIRLASPTRLRSKRWLSNWRSIPQQQQTKLLGGRLKLSMETRAQNGNGSTVFIIGGIND